VQKFFPNIIFTLSFKGPYGFFWLSQNFTRGAFCPPTLTLLLEGGRCEKIDLVLFHVIPAKAGIQCFQGFTNLLDPGFHRGDG